MTYKEPAPPRALHWTSLALFFADGSGLLSVWDSERSLAVQRDGERSMPEAAATTEHLRALAEFRDTGGCANWIASVDHTTLRPPSAQDIDWTGFTAPDSEL